MNIPQPGVRRTVCGCMLGLVFLFIAPELRADTGDVIDDFLPAATGVWWCGGYAGAVWADVDEDGTYDTQVVFTTQVGADDDAGEAQVTNDDPDGKWYFFTFIDSHCGGGPPYIGRGRFTIHFVDILAPGFVWDNPSTWTYKSIPGVSLRTSHDACYGYEDPRFDDPSVLPYQRVQAYSERFQTGPIAPHDEVVIGGWRHYRFGDPGGIKELYISTDFCENVLDDLILHEDPDFPDDLPDEKAGLVLLFDTSGSMNWSHEGVASVPDDEKRLTLAKDAAYPFLQILNDHASGEADFSIVRFPTQPWTGACTGQVITPMTPVNDANINDAVMTTIPGLTATGSTPLLSGLSTALGTFTDQDRRAVVLLSDGYHNCPSTVGPADPEVTTAIANATAASASIFTIGFGRPSDVDHPLLETLASGTGGTFYDVTEPSFDPGTWVPGTALHEAYVAVLAGALALDLGADPRGVIKAGQKITRQIPICGYDKTVSFYLSWATRQAGRLDLTVFSADGSPIPSSAPGVRVHDGTTYRIITVMPKFLSQPGKIGTAPWRIEIDASNLSNAPSEHYQYTVLMNSDVKMDVEVGGTHSFAGSPITIEARLTAEGKPLGSLKNVQVEVSRPQESLGNWSAANQVSANELAQIPVRVGPERLPDLSRKFRFLRDVRKIALPARAKPDTMRLFDDGTHGDHVADDGVYTNSYKTTDKDGTYAFRVRAVGETKKGTFQRELQVDRFVGVRVVAGSLSDLSVEKLPSYLKGIDRLRVTMTPKDALGNHVGSRLTKRVDIQPTWGRVVGEVRDNLDGSYSQIVEIPSSLGPRHEINAALGHVRASTLSRSPKDRDAGESIPTGLLDRLDRMQRELDMLRAALQRGRE